MRLRPGNSYVEWTHFPSPSLRDRREYDKLTPGVSCIDVLRSLCFAECKSASSWRDAKCIRAEACEGRGHLQFPFAIELGYFAITRDRNIAVSLHLSDCPKHQRLVSGRGARH